MSTQEIAEGAGEPDSHEAPPFEVLSKIDFSDHIETKGQFSYVSWPFAIEQLSLHYPDASWEVCRFDGLPYLKTDLGFFVEVAVTVSGLRRSQIHPVLDNRNKPIAKPSPFDINTSIQRCLVKAIALHGLGLYVYAGEDLPTNADPYTKEQRNLFLSLLDGDAAEFYAYSQTLPLDTRAALGNSVDSDKVKFKASIASAEKEGSEAFEAAYDAIQTAVKEQDATLLHETLEDFSREHEKKFLWSRLSEADKIHVKTMLASA